MGTLGTLQGNWGDNGSAGWGNGHTVTGVTGADNGGTEGILGIMGALEVGTRQDSCGDTEDIGAAGTGGILRIIMEVLGEMGVSGDTVGTIWDTEGITE